MYLTKLINNVCEVIIKNQDYLSSLDREIGDGDHGVNLARGFTKIQSDLATYETLSLSEIFKKMAMTLMANVGGASGALYSSGFLEIANYLKNQTNISYQIFVEGLNVFIEAIKKRGQGKIGEKTMLDTLIPAYEEAKKFSTETDKSTLWLKIIEAARQGMDSTKSLIATKGRASYLKERSVDHLDPGAVSSFLIIETIANCCNSEGLGK